MKNLMKETHLIREAQQIKLLSDGILKIIRIIKKKKLNPNFEPSMKTLLRIMKFMIDNDAKGKTRLSLDTNLNYTRLANHMVWMEKKGLTKSTIEDNKINVALTVSGREFASMISKIN